MMKFKQLTIALMAMGLAAPIWAADFTISDFRVEGEHLTSEACVLRMLPV